MLKKKQIVLDTTVNTANQLHKFFKKKFNVGETITLDFGQYELIFRVGEPIKESEWTPFFRGFKYK